MFAKTVSVTYGGKEYFLAYNAWAMFQIQDLSPEKGVMEVLAAQGGEGFSLFCKAAELMSEAAEGICRYEGRETGEPLKSEQIANMARPVDVLELRRAMLEAVAHGYGREMREEEEGIDVGLAELQKKTD